MNNFTHAVADAAKVNVCVMTFGWYCQLCPFVFGEGPFCENVCQLLNCFDVFDLHHWI